MRTKVDADLYRAAEYIATREDRSLADVLRRALREYVNRRLRYVSREVIGQVETIGEELGG